MGTERAVAVLLFVVGIARIGDQIELPSYIKPCKKGDQKCALESTKEAFPRIIKGDKEYKYPPLDPLVIEKMEVEQGGLKIIMENVKIYFVDNLKFTSVTFDVDAKKIGYTFETPLCQILSDYEISGKILVIPISGKGKSNVTIENLALDFTSDIVTERRPDGKNYLTFVNAKHEVKKSSKVYFDFTNLFNGDKTLSGTTLKFLNENWADVFQEVSPLFLEALAEQERRVINNVASGVPVDTLFLE